MTVCCWGVSFFDKFSSDLHSFKAVLVIPDIYHRGHLKELMNLLLTKIGFGSCFFVQVSTFDVHCPSSSKFKMKPKIVRIT